MKPSQARTNIALTCSCYSEKVLELWLIRHGETDWNRERRIQGQQQNPLSALGVKQARRLGLRLEAETFDKVYSSDLRRALQTAQLAVPDTDICQDKRLREISRGVLEGRTKEEMTEEETQLYKTMRQDPFNNCLPGGENFQDLNARVESWLGRLPREGKVVAFAHGGTVHTSLHLLLGVSDAWTFAVNNASITKLLMEEGHTTIAFVNDHAHVMGRDDVWSP